MVPENIHTPPTEGIGNSGEEGGSRRAKNLKQCMKLNWNFRRGGGVIGKIPSVGGVWIFSGTTQFNNSVQTMEVLNGGAFDSVNCQDVGIWPELNARGFA